MPVPLKLVIEFVFFSPFLFLLLLFLFGLYSLRNNSNKFKKSNKTLFLLKSFTGLWILLLITSNVLFFHAVKNKSSFFYVSGLRMPKVRMTKQVTT